MVRAWWRPPDDCFHCAAVPLPAIVIRVVSVVTWGRKNRRICVCVALRDDLSRGEQDKGHEKIENRREEEAVKSEYELEAVDYSAKRCSQGETDYWNVLSVAQFTGQY